MNELLASPARLARRLEKLEAERRAGPASPEVVSALAEGAFRIAVHRSTSPAVAAQLLQRAVRLDRTNPKYHYHLALFCFRFGQLDAAAQWLERARQLCSTSHRIWTHIGLLQRELNERYRDAKYVPDEHLRRWREIAEHVRDGRDAIDHSLASFRPKEVVHPNAPARRAAIEEPQDEDEPPPRRLLAPGVCRWMPIHDLIADDLLESEAGERKRNTLRDPLERAAAAAERDGAPARFVVLASEWLLRGYSSEFIRRIRPACATGDGAAARLLGMILDLLDSDPSAAPQRIADALADQRIPPVVAAAIHRLHTLGPPPSLNKLAADLRRVDAWAGTDEEDAQAFVRTLEQGARSLEPRRRIVIADFPPDERQAAETTPVNVVAASEADLAAMQAELQQSREWLAANRTAEVTDALIADAMRVRSFVLGVKDRTANAIAALAALRVAGKFDTPNAIERVSKLEQSWQGLTMQCGPLMKLLKRYPEPVAAHEKPAETAAEVETQASPAGPLERLRPLAQDLEARLRATFENAAASLDAYTPRQQRAPAIQAMRLSIRARKAEALYRLGKRDDARREWNALLAEDRLSLDVLRNIAVCDSRAGNMHRSLVSWRSYTEMLYFHAISAGDLSRLAAERTELHRNFGNAYAPRPFFDRRRDGQQPEIDPDEVQAFLSSTSRVRLFMHHRLLALLSERLSYRTPPLLLGVTRTAGESAREEARARLEAWTGRLALLLPRRVGPRFAATISAALGHAVEEMKSARAMMALGQSPAYEDERKRYIAWLKDVVAWKVDLYHLLQHFPEASRRPELLDPLVELSAADEIPLDTSDELYNSHVLQERSDKLGDVVSSATAHHVVALLHFVFPSYREPGDAAAWTLRTQLYARLTGELADRAPLRDEGLRSVIDHPAGREDLELYSPSLRRDLKSGSQPSDESVAFLRDAWQRYPRSAGIAHDLGLLLAVSNRADEAKRVLTAAIKLAFHEGGRDACTQLLDQIKEKLG